MLKKKTTATSRETQPEASQVQNHLVFGTMSAPGASFQNALEQCSALGGPFMLKFGLVVQDITPQVHGAKKPASEHLAEVDPRQRSAERRNRSLTAL